MYQEEEEDLPMVDSVTPIMVQRCYDEISDFVSRLS